VSYHNTYLSTKIRYKKNSLKKMAKEFNQIYLDISNEINKKGTTLSVLSKKFKLNFKIKDLKEFKKFKTLAIIGMGGSILGSMSVYNFLETKVKKKVYFFDNINDKKIIDFKKNENIKKVLFLIISKSGNTVETLSNTFALKILKKNAKNIIIIAEKKNNLLFSISKKYNLFYVEHKSFVGGRYSVLSETGIIPSYLMGINTLKLRSKIFSIFKEKNKFLLKDSALKLASMLKLKKFNNLIFINYSPQLKQFLFWCQQLIAESLGKKNKGFLPMISNAPKDHHSLLQLYLDGPKDKLFYIFSCDEYVKSKLSVSSFVKKNINLNKKSLYQIKIAQKNALIKSFSKNKIPFREFKIKKTNEETLGKLFSYFILETVIIGKLLNINPYDQPAVEQVKVFTKNLLK